MSTWQGLVSLEDIPRACSVPAQSDPQQWEAMHRDMVLSPGSPELGAFLFPLDMFGIDSEKQENQCSLHTSPSRTEHSPSPVALALLPAPRVTMAAPCHHCDITVTMVYGLIWPSSMTNGGHQHLQVGGSGKKGREMGPLKNNSGNDPRRNNSTMQYNTVQVELQLINALRYNKSVQN